MTKTSEGEGREFFSSRARRLVYLLECSSGDKLFFLWAPGFTFQMNNLWGHPTVTQATALLTFSFLLGAPLTCGGGL